MFSLTFLGFVVLGHEVFGSELYDYADLIRSTRWVG